MGNGRGGVHTVGVGKPFLARAWYRVWASYDAATRTLTVGQAPLAPGVRADDAGGAAAVLDGAPALDSGTPLLVAALGGAPVAGHYNGKIERPAVYDAALARRRTRRSRAARRAGTWSRSGTSPGTRRAPAPSTWGRTGSTASW